jgi:hypothetical protein
VKAAIRNDARFAFAVTLIATGLWLALGSNVIGMARERDFLNLYTGGLLARTGHLSDLYDYELQSQTQDRLLGPLPLHMPFVRPPFYAVVMAPVSLLPVKAAFPAWIAVQIAGMVAVWIWAWRRFGSDAQVYCAFFLPTSMGIAHGQDCVVLLLVMLGAWTLIEKGKDGAAGAVLALTLFKFHLFLLLPLAMLLRRRGRMLGGYAAGGAALAVISFALAGSQGILGYIHLLTRKDLGTLSPSPEMMVGMNAIAVNLGMESLWAKVPLLAIPVAVVIWAALRAKGDLAWFWTAVLGSMLLSPHTYEYDLCALLIPALIAVFRSSSRVVRVTAATAMIPPFYLFTVAGTPWAIAPSLVVGAFCLALSGLLPAAAPAFFRPTTKPEIAA